MGGLIDGIAALVLPAALSWFMSAFRDYVAKVPSQWVPAVMMVLGGAVAAGASFLGIPVPFDIISEDTLAAGFQGVLSGAASVGYYELVRKLKGE